MTDASIDRLEWQRDVDLYTEADRTRFALGHELRALELRKRCACVPTPSPLDPKLVDFYDGETGEMTTRKLGNVRVCAHESAALWHKNRATAQRERFDRVAMCALDVVTFECGSCKTLHGSESLRCGNYRICVKCRGHRASELRARFLNAHELTLGSEPLDEQRLARTTAELTDAQRKRRAKSMRLRRAAIAFMKVRGGRERFLTLTFPDTGDPSADVLAVYEAWPRFARALRRYLVNSAGIPKDYARHVPFVRVVEVTPGQTGGHVHLHVWMYAPFLPHVVLRQLWARALPDEARARLPVHDTEDELGMSVEQALELERDDKLPRAAANVLCAARTRHDSRRVQRQLFWPVLDVQACGKDVGRELIKYLVKDQLTAGEDATLIDAFDFARIFVALEGRRTIVTSRYFWLLPERHVCAKCSATGFVNMKVDRSTTRSMSRASTHPPPTA